MKSLFGTKAIRPERADDGFELLTVKHSRWWDFVDIFAPIVLPIIFIGFLFCVAMAMSIHKRERMVDRCTAKGGVLIRDADTGRHFCVDKKALK